MHEGKLPVGPIMPELNRENASGTEGEMKNREPSTHPEITTAQPAGAESEDSSEDGNRPTSAPPSLDLSNRLFSFSSNLVGQFEQPMSQMAPPTSGVSSHVLSEASSNSDRLSTFYTSDSLSTSPTLPLSHLRGDSNDMRKRTDSIDKFLSQSPSHALGRKRLDPVAAGTATSKISDPAQQPSDSFSLNGTIGQSADDAMRYINVQSPGQTLNLRKRMGFIDNDAETSKSQDSKLGRQNSLDSEAIESSKSLGETGSKTTNATGTERQVSASSFFGHESTRSSPYHHPLGNGGFSSLSSSFEALNLSNPNGWNGSGAGFKGVTNPVGTRPRSTSPTTVAKMDPVSSAMLDSANAREAHTSSFQAGNVDSSGFAHYSRSRMSSSLEGSLQTKGDPGYNRSSTPPTGALDDLSASLAKRGSSAATSSAPSTPSGTFAQGGQAEGGLYLGSGSGFQGNLNPFAYPAIGKVGQQHQGFAANAPGGTWSANGREHLGFARPSLGMDNSLSEFDSDAAARNRTQLSAGLRGVAGARPAFAPEAFGGMDPAAYYPGGGAGRGGHPMMTVPMQGYSMDGYSAPYGYPDGYGYGMTPHMAKGGVPGHLQYPQQPAYPAHRASAPHQGHHAYKGSARRGRGYRDDSAGFEGGHHQAGGRRGYSGAGGRQSGGGQYYGGANGGGHSNQGHGPGLMIPVDTPLDDCVGQVFQLSQEQNGCRYLQQKVDFEGTSACTKILAEVKPRLTLLMMDPFGNYLFQKLLEHASREQRGEMLMAVKGQLVHAALNLHGTRSVQKFIEVCGRENDDDNMAVLVDCLSQYITKLSMDTNGNHVVQRCLQYMSSSTAQFVYDTVIRDVLVITRHRHGCCVFQRCIDAANKDQRDALVQQVIAHSIQLMQDPFGNYVVQYVLERSQDGETQALIQQLLGGLAHLSMQKFSSNVVEKCLQAAPRETLGPMIQELAEANTMRNMLHDQFANYVVQRALLVANDDQGMQLVNSIRPHLAGLGSFNPSCARRVANRVVKRFPKVASDPVFREFLHQPESGTQQSQHS